MPSYLRFVVRRLAIGVLQVLVLLLLVFGLSLLMPGDAADLAGEFSTQQQRDAARRVLGLDVAPLIRFSTWAARAAGGDFGTSTATGGPVGELIAEPFGMSGLMALLTTMVLLPFAAISGFVAGLRPGSMRDRAISAVSIFFDSIPDFLLAVLLVAYVAVGLGWFPPTFIGVDLGSLLTRPEYLVLPLGVMVARLAAPLVRLVRAGVINVNAEPYVEQARRLGVPRWSLLLRHIAPNALGPAMQELGRTSDGLLSGVLIIEAVFAMPGVASTLIDAVGNRDEPVVLAIVLLTGLVAIVVNIGIDLVAARLSPRSVRR